MGVVYQSPRQTADIDFTTTLDPDEGLVEDLRAKLDAQFPLVAADLGYPGLLCRVQSMRYRPKRALFVDADGPAIEFRIGYARVGSPEERHYRNGQAIHTLLADVSFREPVGAIQVVRMSEGLGEFRAYSLIDLMVENIRAFLQQDVRNRYRRQDIYDVDLLIGRFELDRGEKARLL